jgi:hypothetical protein
MPEEHHRNIPTQEFSRMVGEALGMGKWVTAGEVWKKFNPCSLLERLIAC